MILLTACLGLAAAAEPQRNLDIAPTSAGKRVALVIGNADYGASPLKNPVNDARAIAAKLERLGFSVVKRENLTTRQIGATLREFRSRLVPGSEALFFYAGHGLQVKGVNYLPTVDADITSEEDVPSQSINVSQLLDIMDDTKTRLNLIFLDACRNNPFTRRFRSTGGGLAKIEAPSGTKISFATRPGSVAADGDGSNGLYTEHLLRAMDERGLPIEQALKRVYSGVKQASKGAQEPWEEGTIEGEFYFQPGGGGQGAQVAQLMPQFSGARTAAQIEDELWDAIRESDKASVFEEYLRQYPKGRYQAQARVKLAGLREAAKPVAPALAPVTASAGDTPETALWKAVSQGGGSDDYEVYLAQYPKGTYAALARNRIKKLQDETAAEAGRKEQEARQAAGQAEKFKSLSGQWVTTDGHKAIIDAEGGKLSIRLSQLTISGSADAWIYDEPINRPNVFEIVDQAAVHLQLRESKLAGTLEIPARKPLSGGWCSLPAESSPAEGSFDDGRIVLRMKKATHKVIMNRNDGLFSSPKVRCDEVTQTGSISVEIVLTRPAEKRE